VKEEKKKRRKKKEEAKKEKSFTFRTIENLWKTPHLLRNNNNNLPAISRRGH